MRPLENIPLDDLINRCLANDRMGWEEFFHRFTRLIQKRITKTLMRSSSSYLASDHDIIQEIFLLVVEKIYDENALKQLRQSVNVPGWIAQIAVNKTRDWLKAYQAQKRLAEKFAEETMVSLDAPVYQESDQTYADLLEASDNSVKQNHPVLDEISNTIEISDLSLWALRLKVIFYNAFSDDEVKDLAKFLNKPIEKVKKEIDALMDTLVEQQAEKEKKQQQASNIWAMVRTLESQIYQNLESQDITIIELEQKQTDLAAKKKRLEKMCRQANLSIEPRNHEIAEILDDFIDIDNQVSMHVHAARKKLKSLLKNKTK